MKLVFLSKLSVRSFLTFRYHFVLGKRGSGVSKNKSERGAQGRLDMREGSGGHEPGAKHFMNSAHHENLVFRCSENEHHNSLVQNL